MDWAFFAASNGSFGQRLRRTLADADACADLFVGALQPGGDVHGVAISGVVEDALPAEIADNGLTNTKGSCNRLSPPFTSSRPKGPYQEAGGCVPRYTPCGRTRDEGALEGGNPVPAV